MKIENYVFQFNKKEYILGEKPKVNCILCSLVNGDEKVKSLKIATTYNLFISLNLYPYNNGHIMVFPKRHIIDYRELNQEEVIELDYITKLMITILIELYNPSGFNIGFNVGKFSGASIDHIHQHIIPRYPNELGMIDLIGGARVIIENILETQNKIINKLKKYCEINKIENIYF